MGSKWWGVLCVVVGLAMAAAGYRILQRYERPPGVTGFAGPIVSQHTLIIVAAQFLLVVGLLLAMVFGLIFLLA